MALRVEIREFADGRLMLVLVFTEGSNFWIHEDGTCSYVPKKSELELVKQSLEAVDSYNILKRNLKSRSNGLCSDLS
jgi:hypothetical protein